MTIINFIIIIALIGVLLWAVNTYIPMAPNIKKFLNIAVVILMVIWFLNLIGVFSAFDAPLPRIR